MLTESAVGTSEPTLRDLSEGLIAVYGTDYGIHSPTWITRFTDVTRQAGGLPQGTGPPGRRRRACAFPGRRTGPQHRGARCGEPGMEAGPGGPRVRAGEPPRHLPCRASPGRGARAARHHGASRAPARRRSHRGAARNGVRAVWAWTSRAYDSRRGCPGWTSITTSAPGTRCSVAACPTSIWSPPAARCGSSPCCTRHVRCGSTSVSPAVSTSLRGRTGFSAWTPRTLVRGCFRHSGRSPLPPRC